jgi:L,D-peptidoglycan transpeptidase YkuD (ErfK/YbiS/YcfS/YnhG family)
MVRDKPRKVHHSTVKRGIIGTIAVQARPLAKTTGWLVAGGRRIPCALGRSGTSARKRESDGATPLSRLAFRRVWWRRERGSRPITGLPLRPIRPHDGWCDATGDRNYNRHVIRPYPVSHEAMWRDDTLYDLVVELGWNDAPRRQGRGSAIFMHVARNGFKPTEGCVALTHRDLRWLLSRLASRSRMVISP